MQAAGQWYVFYHRQTNRTEQSRQGCAEPIHIDENGSIEQVEMTSQGLYGKLLPGAGTYPAYIACNLYSEQGAIKCTYGPFCRHHFRMHPCFRMGRDGHQFIQDMRDGATAGFKYFDMQNPKRISVTVRGDSGTVLVRTSPEKQPIAVIQIDKQVRGGRSQQICRRLRAKQRFISPLRAKERWTSSPLLCTKQ